MSHVSVGRVVLGEGVFQWPREERVTDRYGAVYLLAAVGSEAVVPLDLGAVSGKVGTLIAEVLEVRRSRHIGDLFRGIYPVTPDVGARIELGAGWMKPAMSRGGSPCLLVVPADGSDRSSDWLSPHALYRAHEQTVRLVVELL